MTVADRRTCLPKTCASVIFGSAGYILIIRNAHCLVRFRRSFVFKFSSLFLPHPSPIYLIMTPDIEQHNLPLSDKQSQGDAIAVSEPDGMTAGELAG